MITHATMRPRAARGGKTYTIQPTDTLSSIAAEFYDDPAQRRLIYNANREVLGPDPDRIPADVEIVIPPKP